MDDRAKAFEEVLEWLHGAQKRVAIIELQDPNAILRNALHLLDKCEHKIKALSGYN